MQKKRIRKLENRSFEVIVLKSKRKKKENKGSLCDLWDTTEQVNICIRGVPKREEKEKEADNSFEKEVKKTPQIYKNLNKL